MIIVLSINQQLTLKFNPLSPNSDENEISLYIINTCSNIQVKRIKKVIARDKMSWYRIFSIKLGLVDPAFIQTPAFIRGPAFIY